MPLSHSLQFLSAQRPEVMHKADARARVLLAVSVIQAAAGKHQADMVAIVEIAYLLETGRLKRSASSTITRLWLVSVVVQRRAGRPDRPLPWPNP